MAKAPPFAIIYLVIAIYLFFQKKYWPLFIVAFLFTETYDVFPLLVLATLIWVAVVGWTERRIRVASDHVGHTRRDCRISNQPLLSEKSGSDLRTRQDQTYAVGLQHKGRWRVVSI
jgi:hypothetical protein